MSNDLDLAQNAAFQLARTLMVPVSLFEVDGSYGVLPADELDGDDVTVLFEYDPFSCGRPVHRTGLCHAGRRLRAGARKGS